MKRTFIVKVTETQTKYVAVEVDVESTKTASFDAENIAWELADQESLDFDPCCAEREVDATVLGQSVAPLDELWEGEETVDMEDFRYKESFTFNKAVLKGKA